MRRRAVPLSIVVLTLVWLTGAGVVAQEATPTADAMATPAAMPAELAAWAAAWAAADTEAILATYTEDAVFEEVPIGLVVRGHDELRTHIETLKAAFTDFSLVVTNAFVADGWAGAEWVVTGTYTGQFPGLPPGAGQAIRFEGASILELDGDRIRADREYWDAYGLLVAVGALPAPEAEATPAG